MVKLFTTAFWKQSILVSQFPNYSQRVNINTSFQFLFLFTLLLSKNTSKTLVNISSYRNTSERYTSIAHKYVLTMEGSNGDQKVHSLAKKTPKGNDTIIAKIEGLQEKKGAEIITNLPARQKFEKSNSFFDVKQGSKSQQRFKTILDRNAAANPGASHHTPRH
jgi:hypothetical protein